MTEGRHDHGALFPFTLALALLAAPLVAAQPPKKVYRIGLLRYFPCSEDVGLKDLRRGLRELGYVEGDNIVIECRAAAPGRERFAQLPERAAELIRLNVDVLVTEATPPSQAAKQITRTVPIVMIYVGDLVASGLVRSLGRPEANITGESVNGQEILRKDLELLKETAPWLSRVSVWLDPTNPSQALLLAAMETAATLLKVKLQPVDVRTATDLDEGFAATRRQRAEALVVLPLNIGPGEVQSLAEFAIKNRLPAVTFSSADVKAGLLLSYGPNIPDMYHRAAIYIDRILRGAKPADLPVEEPRKYDLVINLKTAKALGLTIPQSMLLRADEVIACPDKAGASSGC